MTDLGNQRHLFDMPEPSESISKHIIRDRGRTGEVSQHRHDKHKNLESALVVVSRRVRVLLALVFRRARVAAAC